MGANMLKVHSIDMSTRSVRLVAATSFGNESGFVLRVWADEFPPEKPDEIYDLPPASHAPQVAPIGDTPTAGGPSDTPVAISLC